MVVFPSVLEDYSDLKNKKQQCTKSKHRVHFVVVLSTKEEEVINATIIEQHQYDLPVDLSLLKCPMLC